MKNSEILKRLYRDYTRKYLNKILLALIFSIVLAGSTSSIAYLLDPAIEKIFLNKDRSLIYVIPFFIIIAFAGKGLSLYGAKVIMIRISEEIKKTLQLDMMKALIKADTNFIEKRHSGKIITNLISDVNFMTALVSVAILNLFKDTSDGVITWMHGTDLYIMLGLVLLTMLIMFLIPKWTKKIPSALVAILAVASITIFGGLDVSTVGSFIVDGGGSGLEGGLPNFKYEIFSVWNTLEGYWSLIISTACLLAAVGLIESLMTLNLVDELTETRGSGNRECIAQGSANILSGLFGGMGGCAMIGQSIINVNSGGRGRLSGLVASISLLCFILIGAPLIEQIPIAALVGVMFMVVIGTFAWSSFRVIRKIPISDAIVLIVVSLVTVWQDLAIAVLVGVIISALVFAWKNALMIRARKKIKADGTKVYEIWGPLFFGSVQNFNAKFDVKNDPDKIEIDFIESKVNDHSGIEAIDNLVNKYLKAGKQIKLTHLSPECKTLLLKANKSLEKIIQTSIDDPRYYVVTDLLDTEV